LTDRRVRDRSRLPQKSGDEVHLEHREAERAPGLALEQLDDLVVPALEHVRGLEKDRLLHLG
jgi:hypothetical protein